MDEQVISMLGEIRDRLDAIAGGLEDHAETAQATAGLVRELHGVWCLEAEVEEGRLPDKLKVPVGPGTRVSWTDPKDASNVAWGGTVEFVGIDKAGTPIAHVDFSGYGRRNLPVADLIIGILT